MDLTAARERTMIAGVTRRILPLLTLLALGRPALATEGSELTTAPIRRVALFKNGLALVERDVQLVSGAGVYEIAAPTAAVHGSVWVSAPPSVRVDELVAESRDVAVEVEGATLAELLRASLGRKIGIDLGEGRALTGTVLDLTTRQAAAAPRYDYASSAYAPVASTASDEVVLVQTDSGVVAVPVTRVQKLEFPGVPSRRFERVEKQPRLSVRVGQAPPASVLGLSYLARGMSWAPSYRIELSADGQAQLALAAVIVNELEPLAAAHVDFVTGFPNLKFANVLSPLTAAQSLSNLLGALEAEPRERRVSQMMNQQIAVPSRDESGAPPSFDIPEVGARREDLFLYPLAAVTLARGASGWYPLLGAKVPFEHVYEWRIPDYVNEQERYDRHEDDKEEQARRLQIWHSVRLQNTTTIPWTTAPAETVSEGMVLGQDVLAYTPVGGKATVRITRAMGLRAEEAERETARLREAEVHYGNAYDRITVGGELGVENFLAKDVLLEVTKELSGKLAAATPVAKVVEKAEGLKQMNPRLELTWKVELKAASKARISYSYEVLVRR